MSAHLTCVEAAAELRVRYGTVLKLIHAGKLAASRVSPGRRGAIRITRASLDAFLESTRVTPPAPRPLPSTRTELSELGLPEVHEFS